MIGSLLVTGGTKSEREEKARKVLEEYQIADVDITILEPEITIGINEIRQLKHQFSLKPYSSQFRAGIVFEAQNLTIPAQNAFLKTLEEPPPQTLIILTTPNKDLLLSTINSRCQIIELPSKPGIEISEEEFGNYLSSIIYHLLSGVGEKLKLAQEAAQNRESAISWLDTQTVVLRKLLVDKNTHKSSHNLSARQILTVLRQIQTAKSQIQANVNPRFTLENFLLNLPKM